MIEAAVGDVRTCALDARAAALIHIDAMRLHPQTRSAVPKWTGFLSLEGLKR